MWASFSWRVKRLARALKESWDEALLVLVFVSLIVIAVAAL